MPARPPLTLFSERVLISAAASRPVSASITVQGSQIINVTEQSRAAFEAAEHRDLAVDLGQALVTPSFTNSHTHLPMAGLRGIEGVAQAMGGDVVKDLYFRIEKQLTRDDVRAFARMGAYESVLNGVGFVWDHYYHGSAVAEALKEVGLAGIVAPTLQDMSGPGRHGWSAAIEETLAVADDDCLRQHGIGAAWGPHATDTVSEKLWRELGTLAATHQLPIHAHLAQSPAECATVSASSTSGCTTPVDLLASAGVLDAPDVRLLLVHGIYVTRADLARLNKDGRHVLVTCPGSHMLFAFPARTDAWLDAGVPVALATDAAASNDGMCVQSELRLLANFDALRTTFSPEAEAFLGSGAEGGADASAQLQALATHRDRTHAHAARARDAGWVLSTVWDVPGQLHPDRQLQAGRLARGHLANLLVWDTDHPNLWPPAPDPRGALVLCSNVSAALLANMVAGQWVGQGPCSSSGAVVRANLPRGAFHQNVLNTPAFQNHTDEATDRLRSLLRRAGIAH